MDRYELQKLRDLPIEGVAERLGLQVVRHKCLCPFHDDHHASMSFSLRRNTFRCFACGAHGGTIDLAIHLLHTDFKEACRWLAEGTFLPYSLTARESDRQQKVKPFDATRYERFFLHPFLNAEACRFLYEERRIDERVVSWCRLTSWRDRKGVPWLQIPYFSQDGRLIGIQNRNLRQRAMPRFRFPQGASCSIYNLPILNRLREGEELWITEGCSDCWAMLSAKHKAIAIPSATLLSRKDAEKLSILNRQLSITFHMYPDQDEPGERLYIQLKKVLPSLVRHSLPQGCKDFSDYYLSCKHAI